jgi:serralysin
MPLFRPLRGARLAGLVTATLAAGAGAVLVTTQAGQAGAAPAHGTPVHAIGSTGADAASPASAGDTPPPTTAAATALVTEDNKVDYTAAEGQTNKVLVTFAPTADFSKYVFTIRDDVAITAGNGCTYPDPADRKQVACTAFPPGDEASDLRSLVVNLGDRDDRLTMDPNSAAYTEIFGGDGDDILLGGGRDVFYGGNGDDRIDGGGGAYGEGANGGPGDDMLTGCGDYCHQD